MIAFQKFYSGYNIINTHGDVINHSIYSIQLSTYAYMYEQEYAKLGIEKKCRQIWIGFHDKQTLEFQKIPVTYLKYEAKRLLEHHKYQLSLKNG